jgi:predicted MFS family arabinose efflux permease
MTTATPAGSSAGAVSQDAPTSFTHRQIVIILAGLMSGMFLAALDQTIVSTAIRTIADDLNGLSIQAWATTAYLITSTIVTPLYGKLSDIYGRRPFFIFAITVFVAGSLLSGAAQSMYQLAAARAFQGIGAGGLFSLALTIIGDIVPPRERAKYQGYFLAVFGTSSVLGPVLGGLFAGANTILGLTGWRWVFLVNVPIGLASLLLVVRTLHSASAIICYVIGLVGIVAFVLAERAYGDEALLPLRLFRGRTFGVGSVLNFIVGMGMFGGLAAVPLYMQIVKGYSPTAAGLLLLPMVIGIMSGTISSGQFIARTGRYIWFPRVGLGLLVIAMVLLHTLTPASSIVVVDAYAFLFGLGLGLNMQTLVLAIQNAVPPQDMGVATSSATFFRQMGGTLGTAVFLSVLFNAVPDKIRAAIEGDSAFQSAVRSPEFAQQAKQLQGGASQALNDSSFINHLPDVLAHPFKVGFADAADVVFLLGAFVIAVAFVIVWFLPEEKLRSQSGIEAREAQEMAAGAALGDMAAGDAAEGQPAPAGASTARAQAGTPRPVPATE